MVRKSGYDPNSERNQEHLGYWLDVKGMYPGAIKRAPRPKQDHLLKTLAPGITVRLGTIPARGINGTSMISCSVYHAGQIAAMIYDQIKAEHQQEIEEGLVPYEVDWREAKVDRQIRIYKEACTLDKEERESCARWMIEEAAPLMRKVIEPFLSQYSKRAKAA